MADIGFHDDPGAEARGGTVQRLVNLSGAAVSLALIGGLAVWGYELLVRDVTGVPVIQAMEGAFRTAPEEPGGMTAPHQGLAVNEIAAVGSASGPADAVRLAPPPVTLAEDDVAVADLIPEIAPVAAADAGGDELAMRDGLRATAAPSGEAPALDGPAEIGIAIDAAPGDALAIDRAVAEALADTLGSEPEAAAPAAGITLATAVSRRPAPRPAVFRAEDAAAIVPARTAPAAPGTEEVAAGTLPTGTRLAQLGAFSNVEIARAEWDRTQSMFEEYFAGKRRVIQRAEAGGRTFYRLRAEGFDDLADARRFCSALAAGDAECVPVELR